MTTNHVGEVRHEPCPLGGIWESTNALLQRTRRETYPYKLDVELRAGHKSGRDQTFKRRCRFTSPYSFRVIFYIPAGGKKWGMQCVNWFVEVSPPDGSGTSGLEFNSRFGFRDIPSGIAKRRSQAMWLSVAYKYYSVIDRKSVV